MASVIIYMLLVCLSIATICEFVGGQGLNPERGVTFHLRAMCAPYQLEVAKTGHSCNSHVIDEVHDYAESVHLQGYNRELVEEYLDFAKTGQLCYGEGMTIYKITGDCDCMSKVCDRYNPKTVDYCSNIVLSPFAPSGNLSSPYDCYGFGCYNKNSPGLISGAQRITTQSWMMLVSVAMVTAGVMTSSSYGRCPLV